LKPDQGNLTGDNIADAASRKNKGKKKRFGGKRIGKGEPFKGESRNRVQEGRAKYRYPTGKNLLVGENREAGGNQGGE